MPTPVLAVLLFIAVIGVPATIIGGAIYANIRGFRNAQFTARANTPGTREYLHVRLREAEVDQLVANHRRDLRDAIGDVRLDPPQ